MAQSHIWPCATIASMKILWPFAIMPEKPRQNHEKYILRMPKGMREAIARRAKSNGRSMNSEILSVLLKAFPTHNAVGESALVLDNILNNDMVIATINDYAGPSLVNDLKELKEILLTVGYTLNDGENARPEKPILQRQDEKF